MAALSRTQIDHLGNRLRRGLIGDADLRMLDEYRRSFGEAYANVVQSIRQQLHLEPTGRPAKSTSSIIEKLRRESIRLTQVQDIAGCRLIVPDIVEQERVMSSLQALFSKTSIVDRRKNPSHGYRAVHMIVQISKALIEVQIRTEHQHLWAELSEKLADTIDPAIKYGGGTARVRDELASLSDVVAQLDEIEMQVDKITSRLGRTPEQEEGLGMLEEARSGLRDGIRDLILSAEELTGDDP